jgi:hypothetical protein
MSKARVTLGDVVKRAHLNGEYFILEKDGIPIAGIMDADELVSELKGKGRKTAARKRT